jgi:Iap family predicted aminopeptidase
MHALIKDGQVFRYPYGVSDLRRDNPNVSFPKNMSDEALAEHGVMRVFFSTPPEITYTQDIKEGTPVFTDSRWTQTWSIVDLSEEQLAERTEQKAEEIRSVRNTNIAKTDWTQLPDSPVNKQAWAAYRQALRDVPAQEGFPWDVTWPEQLK